MSVGDGMVMQLHPGSVRNHYGMGVFEYREDHYDEAQKEFEAAVSSPCTQGTEHDICAWIKGESKRVLELLKKR